MKADRTGFVMAGLILVSGAAFPPTSPADTRSPVFEEKTPAALRKFVLQSGTPEKRYIVEAMTGGVCLFDYDSDGYVDVYMVNGGTLEAFQDQKPSPLRNALFRNLGNREFVDVTEKAGVGGNGWWGMGCSVADFDDDGHLDLYVTNYGDNLLYRNLGDGTFADVTEQAGVNDPRWSTGSAWADFDGDGDLDLFVANYVELDPGNLPQPGSSRYGSMGSARLGCEYRGLAVMCGPQGLKGAGDSFFVNQGKGRFAEKSRELGLDDSAGYYGLGAIWCDFDGDGHPDLYVANDSTPNYLYHNQGDGSFEEIGLLSGTAASYQGLAQAGMGVDCGDYLNEGRFSIYVTNFSEEYNTLYHNEGNLNFTDRTVSAGLGPSTLPFVGWGTFFFDYDNDGWLDLFVANGHVFPQVDQLDTRSVEPYRQRDLLFRNLRNGRFEEVREDSGLDRASVSRGAAVADLDNDGALDIVIQSIDSSPAVYWNRGTTDHHYLILRLRGTASNRFAVGARVRMRSGNTWRMREVRSGGSYLSHNDLRVHFGLGKASRADEIEIRWPNGRISRLKNVEANQILTITEPALNVEP